MGHNLLEADPNAEVTIEHDRTGWTDDVETDEDGIARNDRGQAFSAGTYSVVE